MPLGKPGVMLKKDRCAPHIRAYEYETNQKAKQCTMTVLLGFSLIFIAHFTYIEYAFVGVG